MHADHVGLLQDSGATIDVLCRIMSIDGTRAQRARAMLGAIMNVLKLSTLAEVMTVVMDHSKKPFNREIVSLTIAGRDHDPDAIERRRSTLKDQLSTHYVETVHDLLINQRRTDILVYEADLARDHEWRDSPLKHRIYAPMGYDDGLHFAWRSNDSLLHACKLYTPEPLNDRNRYTAWRLFRAMQPLVDRYLLEQAAISTDGLSKTQKEVLCLALTGSSEKEIAQQIHRSWHTVHSHLKDIYRHFKVKSRGELIALFIDNNREAAKKHSGAAASACNPVK